MSNHIETTLCALVAATALILVPGPAAAQASGTDSPPESGGMKGHMMSSEHMKTMGEAGSTMDCEQMRAKMKEMRDRRQQMQADLAELADKVESSTGDEQQRAMAELLTTMVEQRGAMQDMMAKMRPMMMGHMMRHMKSGGADDMSGCPMMQTMAGSTDGDETGGDPHETHN
ncbi:MAG TPA: hypothetical protein VLB51_12055 [Methylomirabilota bacterium]|nr:hypothetical protein [Methylomirabilota bacterium]